MNSTQRTDRRCRRAVVFACCAAAAVLLKCSDPLEPAPEPDPFELRVPSLNANYRRAENVVRLSWQAAQGEFDFYKIYRTNVVDSFGRPDTSTLRSVHLKDSLIVRGSSSYDDAPGVSNGIYYYAIRAVRIVDDTLLEGRWSPVGPTGGLRPVACSVGVNVSFSINRGDRYVLTPECSLFVEDPWHELSSVRFTQYSTSGGQDGRILDPDDVDSQVYDLSATVIFGGGAGVGGGFVPDFGASDPQNQTSPSYNGSLDVNAFPWRLRWGTGLKQVWAEVAYRDGRRDTIYETIETEPHNVQIVLRHEATSGLGSERTKTTEVSGGNETSVSVLYTSRLRFSVKIYGDSSIAPEFDAWIMTNRNNYQIAGSYMRDGWYMTKPRSFGLTGVGDEHRSDYEYTYSLVPIEEGGGRANLSRLISGEDSAAVDTIIRGTPEENRALIDELIGSSLEGYGRKQFLLVVRFTEQYFGGKFIKIYGYDGEAESERTYRDLYLPLMNPDNNAANTGYIEDGDTIRQPFDFILDTLSLVDGGLANTVRVSLLISQLPEGYAWDPSSTPGGLTPEALQEFSHRVIPFDVEYIRPITKHVRWEDIDPTGWTTGHYAMAVLVEDDKGNSGFANVPSEYTHPFRVFVKGGY